MSSDRELEFLPTTRRALLSLMVSSLVFVAACGNDGGGDGSVLDGAPPPPNDLLLSLAAPDIPLIVSTLEELGEASVDEIADRLGVSVSAVSQHIAKLRAYGLFAPRRDAQTIYYRFSDRWRNGRLRDAVLDPESWREESEEDAELVSGTDIPSTGTSEANELLLTLASPEGQTIVARLEEIREIGVDELVVEISDALGVSVSAVSQHIAKLRAFGLVAPRRDAQTIWYRLTGRHQDGLLRDAVLHYED